MPITNGSDEPVAASVPSRASPTSSAPCREVVNGQGGQSSGGHAGSLSSATPKRFYTILADPPWDVLQSTSLGAVRFYDLMTLNQIRGLPVGDLAQKDAHLWLWVTNATLRVGYEIAESWGFTVRNPLTWVKFRLGLGSYLRNSTEHMLFCTRGRAPVRYQSQPTWFNAPVQEHSRKPEEQYALIERVSPGPYLELFARRRQPGWAVWGNEIASDITIPGYPVPSDRHDRRRLRGSET